MLVKVAGKVTAYETVEKDGRKYTNLLLLQLGERRQVPARLVGHRHFDLFEDVELTGRLVSWRTREGAIEHMVLVDEA